jgi:hypothetical protein
VRRLLGSSRHLNPVQVGHLSSGPPARRQGRQLLPSTEHRTEYPNYRRPITGPRSPLMRLTCPSKASSRPSASWVRRSHLVVRPPRGLRHARHHLFYQAVILPRASAPLQSLTRIPRSRPRPLLLLSRGFVPPQRNPIRASHHPRTLPVRVLLRPCRSSRLRRLAPARISRMCFNPARSRGFFPSELDLTTIADASRRDIPSCDWHPACRRGPKTVCGGCASPETRADRNIRRCPSRPG